MARHTGYKWCSLGEIVSCLWECRRVVHGWLERKVHGLLLNREMVHCCKIEAISTRLKVHGVGHCGLGEHWHAEFDLI